MKLQAQIGDYSAAIELARRDGVTIVTIDDRLYEIEAHELPNGNYALRNGADVHERLIGLDAKHRDSFDVHVHGRSYTVQITDQKRRRGSQTSSGYDHGAA